MIVDELVLLFKPEGQKKAVKAVDEVDKKLDAAKKNLKKLERQAKKTGKESDKLAVEKGQKLVSSLQKQRRQIVRNTAALGILKKTLGAAGKGIQNLSRTLLASLATSIGTVGGALTAAVKGMASDADRIITQSKELGVTTKKFQELEFAAEKNGLKFEQFSAGLRALQTRLLEVSNAGKDSPMAQPFDDLGLSVKELIKLKPDQQIRKIADEVQKYGSTAQVNARLAKIFGEDAGPKFAELLSGGAKGIDELAEKAHLYGRVMSEEVLANADEVAEAQMDLKAALTGLRNTVAISFLPMAKELIETLRDWIVKNKELVGTRVKEFVENTIPVLSAMLEAAKPIVEVVGELAKRFSELDPATQKAIVKWGALTLALGSFIGPAAKAFGWLAKLASKLGLISGSLGAIAGAGGFAALGLGFGAYQTYQMGKKVDSYKKSLGRLEARRTDEGTLEALSKGLGVSKKEVAGLGQDDLRTAELVLPQTIKNYEKQLAKAEKRLANYGYGLNKPHRRATKTLIEQTKIRLKNLRAAQALVQRQVLQNPHGALGPAYGPAMPPEDPTTDAMGSVFQSSLSAKPGLTRRLANAAKQGQSAQTKNLARKAAKAAVTTQVTINNNSTNVNVGDFIVRSNSNDPRQVAVMAREEFRSMLEKEIFDQRRKGPKELA